jgi:hypothetical protein
MNPSRFHVCSKKDSKFPLKNLHLGGSMALKVLGHHNLQDPLHLATRCTCEAYVLSALPRSNDSIHRGFVWILPDMRPAVAYPGMDGLIMNGLQKLKGGRK